MEICVLLIENIKMRSLLEFISIQKYLSKAMFAKIWLEDDLGCGLSRFKMNQLLKFQGEESY